MRFVRTIVLYGVLLLAFIGAIYAVNWMDKPEAEIPVETFRQENRLQRIDVIQLTPQHYEQTITIPGVVEAEEDVTLGTPVPGILGRKLVEEGQSVAEGDELFRIDMRARKAQLSEIESAFNLAKKNFERIESLFKKGNITRQEYDDAVSRKEQTEAAMERMKVQVSLGTIEAPISGIVDKVYVDEGEYMHEGHELARLLRLDTVELRAGVAERYADAVSRYREGSVFIEALQERRPAIVERVAFGGDTGTNTYEVTITLENPEHRIRPAMIAMIELVIRKTDDALLVPFFSIIRSEKGMMVFVEQDGVVEERVIQLGGFYRDYVEVEAGLEAGERVVVTGQKELVHQQEVQVMQAEAQESIYTDSLQSIEMN